MLPYFEKLTDGSKQANELWALADQIRVAQKKNTESYDFSQLVDVISKETFPNGIDITDKLSDATEAALEQFRKTVLPDNTIALRDYFDIEQLLIAAYQMYETARDKLS